MENKNASAEYCKNNKVYIHVNSPGEIQRIDEILKNNNAHGYLYKNLAYKNNDQYIASHCYMHTGLNHITENNLKFISSKEFFDANENYQKGDYVWIKFTGQLCCSYEKGFYIKDRKEHLVQITRWADFGFTIPGTKKTIFYESAPYCVFNDSIVYCMKDMSYIIRKASKMEIVNHTKGKKIIGAICIKDFPGNAYKVKLPEFDGQPDFGYQSYDWNKYNPERFTEHWKIVYEETPLKISVDVRCGGIDGIKYTIQVVVTPGKSIEYKDCEIPIANLENLLNFSKSLLYKNGPNESIESIWETQADSFRIGCHKYVLAEDIKKVIDVYHGNI